ncbi:radical SAM protein [Actinosynnema sp. NPDC020468]|uniref:radical SAM protein n=1 Tax=Actinosynnema sp. NPDC020468 TaxID=3154488 RepID=UPI00340405FD
MNTDPGGRPRLRLLDPAERPGVLPELLEVVEHRKSGLSLNWIVGCPLDCGYCVRHLFGNFGMKVPRALTSDAEAVEALVGHPHFTPHRTPVQLLNRATDPFLPAVKPHLFAVLRELDARGLTNHVLVITRWRVEAEDCVELNALRHLKVTLLVTWSGIDDERVEPVDSDIAARSLHTAHRHADRYRTVLYWRPVVPGLNDSDTHLTRAAELADHAHATVFTGLFYRDEIQSYYRDHGLPEPYEDTARRKILPRDLEHRALRAFGPGRRLFRKTSCAVAFTHALPDYNGHRGILELCGICPAEQVRRCATAWTRPEPALAAALVHGLGGRLVEVGERALIVEGLDEQRRYRVQHELGYQVHDAGLPHHPDRHGRAEIGWPTRQDAS